MQIKQSEVYLMSIFGVFHATRGPSLFITLFIYLFCGVQKDISRKKYHHVFKATIRYLWTKYHEF